MNLFCLTATIKEGLNGRLEITLIVGHEKGLGEKLFGADDK